MNDALRRVLSTNTKELLGQLRLLDNDSWATELVLVSNKTAPGQWAGTHEDRPSTSLTILTRFHGRLKEMAPIVQAAWDTSYPGRSGIDLADGGYIRFFPESVLSSLTAEVYERLNGQLDILSPTVDSVVSELAEFLNAKEWPIVITAEVAGLKLTGSTTSFEVLPGTRVTPLPQVRVSRVLYGEQLNPSVEYEITTECVCPLGPSEREKSPRVMAKKRILEIELALRTFKSGSVRIASISEKMKGYCPFGHTTSSNSSQSNAGPYKLSDLEIPDFIQHYARIQSITDTGFRLALRRLSESTVRSTSVDKIVDAVIGLEAILLDGKSGELRQRFALNYGSICANKDDRLRWYGDALAAYDLRSAIVHGEHLDETSEVKFGPIKVKLRKAEEEIQSMLRNTLRHFLSKGNPLEFREQSYWTRRHLGLEAGA